jgi:hypothetical protein
MPKKKVVNVGQEEEEALMVIRATISSASSPTPMPADGEGRENA